MNTFETVALYGVLLFSIVTAATCMYWPGCPGDRGFEGVAGIDGAEGPQGSTGPKGLDGRTLLGTYRRSVRKTDDGWAWEAGPVHGGTEKTYLAARNKVTAHTLIFISGIPFDEPKPQIDRGPGSHTESRAVNKNPWSYGAIPSPTYTYRYTVGPPA